MAALYNLARMSTTTTGTGTITLATAVSGYLSFANAGVPNGAVVSYGIADGANCEVGVGTYSSSGPTLTRGPIGSNNSNAAINLSGNAQVFICALAQDIQLVFTPQMFGATGNGSTDDTTAFQNAINAAQSANGGKVFVPSGQYLINGGLTITDAVTIEGVGYGDYAGYFLEYTPTTYNTYGSCIVTTTTSNSPFNILNTATGASIRRLGFRQNQPAEGSGFSPTAYPPCITTGNSNDGGTLILEDLYFFQVYDAIQIGAAGTFAGRVFMNRIIGGVYNIGIQVIAAGDVIRGNAIHLGNGFVPNNPYQTAYMQSNSIGIYSVRNDNSQWSNIMIGGFYAGFYITNSSDGSTNKIKITNLDCDYCQHGIFIVGGTVTGHIANFDHQAPTSPSAPGDGIGLWIQSNAAGSYLDVVNFRTVNCYENAVKAEGSGTDLAITNLAVENWNQAGTTDPAIVANTGATITLSGRLRSIGGNGGAVTSGPGTIHNSYTQ